MESYYCEHKINNIQFSCKFYITQGKRVSNNLITKVKKKIRYKYMTAYSSVMKPKICKPKYVNFAWETLYFYESWKLHVNLSYGKISKRIANALHCQRWQTQEEINSPNIYKCLATISFISIWNICSWDETR